MSAQGLTYKRGKFVFYERNDELVESAQNAKTFALMMVACQEIEDYGPKDETERAVLMVDCMVRWGFLDPKKWAQ